MSRVTTDLAHDATQRADIPAAAKTGLAAGDKVGDYVVDRFLGAGAMGEVYAGHHPVIGKKVAIKILKGDLARDHEATERFIREAKATNQIDHPNVIDIFNFGTLPDGRLFLVMDLVAGSSLRGRLAKGPLPVERAVAVLGTIADALDAAHARGVIHRDLKPDNVMITDADQIFVLDFGIARLVGAADAGKVGNGTLTGQGTWLGTPGYMAPEQWSSDGAGPASDRYALGVMAFELLAGKLPFSAPNLPAMMEQHFRAPVPALGTQRGPIVTAQGESIATETLDPVLARAMAKNPDDRFPTGRAMVEALQLASGTGTGPAVKPAAKKVAKQAETAKRLPIVPAAIGVGVLGASIAAVVALRSPPTKDAPAIDDTAAPAGTVAMTVSSIPSGATVRDGDRVLGPTPQTIFPKQGGALAIVVDKPGYVPVAKTIAADAAHPIQSITLTQMNSFEGVWRLPNGELREMKRNAERVDIFKRRAVTGPSEPFRSYDIGPPPAGEKGLVFAGVEHVVDGRSADLGCNIDSKVAYHYDPSVDALDVAREKVGTKIEDGRCVVVSREMGAPEALARVDNSGDVHYQQAPVGKAPVFSKSDANNGSKDNLPDNVDTPRRPGDDKSIPLKEPVVPPDVKQRPSKVQAVENAVKSVPKTVVKNAQKKAGANQASVKPLPPLAPPNAVANQASPPPSQIAPQQQVPTANPEPEQAVQQQQAPIQQPAQQRVKN